jgi:mRNA-degrading endonuclease RelE of RelBE toxin-antitoxin system
MNFEVIATEPFGRKLKRLAKKHRSLRDDLAVLIDQLAENPTLGTPIGRDCFKIRMAISSKGKGKSGGARVITFVRNERGSVYLMDIYDKSEQADIPDAELRMLIEMLRG